MRKFAAGRVLQVLFLLLEENYACKAGFRNIALQQRLLLTHDRIKALLSAPSAFFGADSELTGQDC